MATQYCMGIDVGGSHITLDLVNDTTLEILPQSTIRKNLNTNAAPIEVLSVFEAAILECAAITGQDAVRGVGLAIPGPFNYSEGICKITPAQQKYEQMFGINFRASLCNALTPSKPIIFNNDAACFAMGEYFRGGAKGFENAIVVTLGTGFGASFLLRGRPQSSGVGVTKGGELWDVPYREGIADDYFSTRWLVNEWKKRSGSEIAGGKELARAALSGNAVAQALFREFGSNLAEFITPWLNGFKADAFVIGGNLALDWNLFVPALEAGLAGQLSKLVAIKPCTLGEQAPIYGAALALTMVEPAVAAELDASADIDIDAILTTLQSNQRVMIDGAASTPWSSLCLTLDRALRRKGIKALWFDASAAHGADGSIDAEQLANIRFDSTAALNILIGTNAAEANWDNAAKITL
ncbi:MAG: ROK family protein [Kiritimatiellae bacterium]|nr:ROK family protein [Kiritimatiellia bacterium]